MFISNCISTTTIYSLSFQTINFVHLVSMIDARPGVKHINTNQGSIRGRMTEDDLLGSAVEQGHGAHVAGFLVEVDVIPGAQISSI